MISLLATLPDVRCVAPRSPSLLSASGRAAGVVQPDQGPGADRAAGVHPQGRGERRHGTGDRLGETGHADDVVVNSAEYCAPALFIYTALFPRETCYMCRFAM